MVFLLTNMPCCLKGSVHSNYINHIHTFLLNPNSIWYGNFTHFHFLGGKNFRDRYLTARAHINQNYLHGQPRSKIISVVHFTERLPLPLYSIGTLPSPFFMPPLHFYTELNNSIIMLFQCVMSDSMPASQMEK